MTYIEDMVADLKARGKVKACPVCFREILWRCYHDGENVKTIEISEEERKRRRLRWLDDCIEYLSESLNAYRDERADLEIGPGDFE